MPATSFRAIETTGFRRTKLVELKPNWPSAGVQAAYQKKLQKLLLILLLPLLKLLLTKLLLLHLLHLL